MLIAMGLMFDEERFLVFSVQTYWQFYKKNYFSIIVMLQFGRLESGSFVSNLLFLLPPLVILNHFMRNYRLITSV